MKIKTGIETTTSETTTQPRNDDLTRECNANHRTVYHGDCLEFMRGINSSSVHLIATDPPFNKNKDFHATPSDLHKGGSLRFRDRWSWRDIQDGSLADVMNHEDDRFAELIAIYDRVWGETMAAFITFLSVRALEMHRILRPDGTLYWHCDSTAAHYIKPMLDIVFGTKHFRDEVIWYKGYRGTPRQRAFQGEHETILRYSKSDEFTWNQPWGSTKTRR